MTHGEVGDRAQRVWHQFSVPTSNKGPSVGIFSYGVYYPRWGIILDEIWGCRGTILDKIRGHRKTSTMDLACLWGLERMHVLLGIIGTDGRGLVVLQLLQVQILNEIGCMQFVSLRGFCPERDWSMGRGQYLAGRLLVGWRCAVAPSIAAAQHGQL